MPTRPPISISSFSFITCKSAQHWKQNYRIKTEKKTEAPRA